MVMIVGCRSVGGYRVGLDDFTVAVMNELGARTINRERRKLRGKTIPPIVNRFARAEDSVIRAGGRVKTINEEQILTFTKNI